MASFQVWPLSGMLAAAAILVFAIPSLLPQLRNRPAVPAGLTGAAQWANQPASDFGQRGQQAPHPGQAQHYGQPGTPLYRRPRRPAASATASIPASSWREARPPPGARPPWSHGAGGSTAPVRARPARNGRRAADLIR